MRENFIILVVILFLIGCGSETISTETPATEGTITITGSLGTGTISAGLAKATAPASDYTVVVVDNSSNKTYRATTNSDGTFSVDVPSDSTYLVSLVNNGSYIGPTVFSSSETEVNTAITPSASTDLGSITVDEGEGYARTETAPSAVDTDVVAVATDGKPFGAGHDGKRQNEDITEANLRDDLDCAPSTGKIISRIE